MSRISKPRSLGELKALMNNFKGMLSEENRVVLDEIIREMEKSGGVNKSNKSQIKSLMNRLASQNGVRIPKR
ncbi:MAG: hypothetical protein PHT78_09615 [Desulfitobacteriaceae bacterium]|nr:hypothetical protein [Desulfitobacteriaceae bacterium]